MQITKSAGTRKNLTTIALVLVALLPLAALSCHSGPPRGSDSGARMQPPEPLVGTDSLLGDTVEVRATVAMGGSPGPGAGRPPGGGGRPPGGGMPMGGPPGEGLSMGGPPPGMGGSAAPREGAGVGMAGGRGGPSHALTVVFTNTGSETVEFTIAEVKSRLGNFLPQPDTLALAPGQKGALYPMRGSLPDDVAALELTVTIRTKDGRTDTRVVRLSQESASGVAGGP